MDNGMDNQDNKIKTESLSQVDFLNMDLSSQNQECECNCSALEYLGFELFEIIVLTLIGIGMAFLGYKLILHCRNVFLKLSEERELNEQQKLEKIEDET